MNMCVEAHYYVKECITIDSVDICQRRHYNISSYLLLLCFSQLACLVFTAGLSGSHYSSYPYPWLRRSRSHSSRIQGCVRQVKAAIALTRLMEENYMKKVLPSWQWPMRRQVQLEPKPSRANVASASSAASAAIRAPLEDQPEEPTRASRQR